MLRGTHTPGLARMYAVTLKQYNEQGAAGYQDSKWLKVLMQELWQQWLRFGTKIDHSLGELDASPLAFNFSAIVAYIRSPPNAGESAAAFHKHMRETASSVIADAVRIRDEISISFWNSKGQEKNRLSISKNFLNLMQG